MKEVVIELTTAEPQKILAVDGPHRIDIVGTFGGGTVTPYSYTEEAGRGAQLVLDGTAYSTAVADYYRSESPLTDYELTGATGGSVQIIATPIVTSVRSA